MKHLLTFLRACHLLARRKKLPFLLLLIAFLLSPPAPLEAKDETPKAVRRDPQATGAPIPKDQKRTALVIGNSEYVEDRLRNPANDAQDFARVLRDLGFKVETKINVNHQEMEEAINNFVQDIQNGDVALFYFSGHGIQTQGRNFLIPIGSAIRSEADVRFRSVEAEYILAKMGESRNRINILVLDACRNNPFRGVRSWAKGLTAMEAPKGTFVAYATAPGSVAEDGRERNSPYTKHLVQAVTEKGITIEQAFKQVLRGVQKETSGKQVPWYSSSITDDFYFNPPALAPPTTPTISPPLITEPPKKRVAALLLKVTPPDAGVQVGSRDMGRTREDGLLIVNDAEVGVSMDIKMRKEGFKEKSIAMIIPNSFEGRVYEYQEISLEPIQDRLPEWLISRSKKYHKHYVESEKDEMMEFYDFPIKYYDRGFQDRSFVDREWEDYFARWNTRESDLKSVELLNGSVASGEVTVRLAYSYRWTNVWGKEATGTASSFITWKKKGSEWKIKELDEKRGIDTPVVAAPPAASSWLRAVVKDSDGFACLRGGKGKQFECFEQVSDGEEISVEKSDEEWRRVKTNGGQAGFMHFSRFRVLPDKGK